MLKRFASRNGGSNEVEAVIAKLRFFVTAAIADIGCLNQYFSSNLLAV